MTSKITQNICLVGFSVKKKHSMFQKTKSGDGDEVNLLPGWELLFWKPTVTQQQRSTYRYTFK